MRLHRLPLRPHQLLNSMRALPLWPHWLLKRLPRLPLWLHRLLRRLRPLSLRPRCLLQPPRRLYWRHRRSHRLPRQPRRLGQLTHLRRWRRLLLSPFSPKVVGAGPRRRRPRWWQQPRIQTTTPKTASMTRRKPALVALPAVTTGRATGSSHPPRRPHRWAVPHRSRAMSFSGSWR